MRVHKLHEERRQEIIHVSQKLFIENGFEKTSIAQIAKAVGVAKGLFYYYFETKEDVLDAVIDSLCDKHIEAMNVKMRDVWHEFFSCLLILMDVYYEVHPNFNTHGNSELMDSRVVDAFHARYLERIHGSLERIVELGKQQGYMKLKHPEMMVMSILEGVFGLTLHFELSKKVVTEVIEQSLNLPDGSLFEEGQTFLTNFKD